MNIINKKILPVIFAVFSVYQIIISGFKLIYILNASKGSQAVFFAGTSRISSNVVINSFGVVVISYLSTIFVFACVLIFAIWYLLNKGIKSNTVFMYTCIFCALFGLTAYAVLNRFELTHSYIPVALTLLAGITFYNIYNRCLINNK